MIRHDSVKETGRGSGVGRADDAEQVADRAQSDRQCPDAGGLVHDQEPRAKGIAKGLAQAQVGK
jgi:hypothetical protein